ncbi:hypothetical protein C8F01DRAFT_1251334 [Mycena amicta]|nr:hypothetical protein C8F01DRAFT_1251334 [Mycena amicta]
MSDSPEAAGLPLPPSPASTATEPAKDDQRRRVEELWFNDGTLVIKAENLLFRVYGGLLAKVSPIFEAMLAIPQPKDMEQIDGCPVVELPDAAHDTYPFLKALFDYRFFLPPPEKTRSRTICGVLRLSTKYEVEELKVRAFKHFATAFVLDLEAFPGSPTFDCRVDEFIHIVLLARELCVDWILPLVFYQLFKKATLVDLITGVDLGAGKVSLAAEDTILCAREYLAIRLQASSDICDFLWTPAKIPNCARPNRCAESRTSVRRDVETWRTIDGLLPLTLWDSENWNRLSVCETCAGVLKENHTTALRAFWDGLPARFELEAWDVLKKKRDQDLQLPSGGTRDPMKDGQLLTHVILST